ncbi:hypothetical protein A3B56_01495 [Candidatus Roizmanbacteria bacterium RIFCSPLOWO2_01_FULL_45_11]|uniref:Uncharacterized protein n=1 Tax=Candidatus Roizmanbacteria bacterium RIFCSPLOWO2_01_FULL_45_11 TaxID=1802070 RepID=A0A1F7JES5_9BACT|nr:MAG: hypothetical protein A3B56_01495 [Candidatus Roizmanbacteria bacterium RIFCSPLOWO2_01_FULL_45_11]
MKIQDILFIITLGFLIFMRKERLTALTGLVFIILSMPLFYVKTALFTAERLTMYAAGVFLFHLIMNLYEYTNSTST